MAKLNQIIAIEKQVKKIAEDSITQAYQIAQRAEVFEGHVRTYTPIGDPTTDPTVETLPTDTKKVQVHVDELLEEFSKAQVALFDITATKVYANTQARADVVVDGETLLENVPVEYLLFLEKRLELTMQFLSKIPTLSNEFTWGVDSNTGNYITQPTEQNRTKKVMRNHVKAEATDKHPAQVEVYTEDIVIGKYTTVRHSGAVTGTYLEALKDRVLRVLKGVKQAREEANSGVATDIEIGSRVFSYLLNPNS